MLHTVLVALESGTTLSSGVVAITGLAVPDTHPPNFQRAHVTQVCVGRMRMYGCSGVLRLQPLRLRVLACCLLPHGVCGGDYGAGGAQHAPAPPPEPACRAVWAGGGGSMHGFAAAVDVQAALHVPRAPTLSTDPIPSAIPAINPPFSSLLPSCPAPPGHL